MRGRVLFGEYTGLPSGHFDNRASARNLKFLPKLFVTLLLRSSAFQHSLFETRRNLETQRKRGAEKVLERVGPCNRKELRVFWHQPRFAERMMRGRVLFGEYTG